jgi:hypothetical protein
MAWHKFLAVGFVAGLAATACTVTTSDGGLDSGTSGGSGGAAAGSGGTSGGSGGTTGGSGGTSGDAAAGAGGMSGGAGGGGGAGGAVTCDPNDPDACSACVQTNCCDLWLNCTTDACAGTGTETGEVQCVIDCMNAIAADAGSVSEADYGTCGGQCAQGDFGQLTTESDELLSCMYAGAGDAGADCAESCFGLF